MVPKGLNAFGTFAHAAESGNQLYRVWECLKIGFFFPKDLTYRDFFVLLHKKNFFRMVAKGLNPFGTFGHAAESGN